MENVKFTRKYIESVNEHAEKIGFPKLIIADGYVYKDLLHQILGIGIKLEEDDDNINNKEKGD